MNKKFQLECTTMILTKHNVLKRTKKELIELLGLCFNDVNSNVWMYRLKSNKQLLSHRYLYVVFADNKVNSIHLTRHKTNRFLDSITQPLN